MPTAQAGTNDCSVGDAPTDYETATCAGHCQVTMSGEWKCDMEALGCSTATAWVVHDYNDTGIHDFSAWGECDTTKFCCTFDDEPTPFVEKVVLIGTSGNDELSFSHATTTTLWDHLRPHVSGTVLGFVYGRGGADLINGSGHAASNYRDNLYGEAGGDTMYGYADGDFMSGGDDNDILDGGIGDDRMLGGPGDDTFYGGEGINTMCDASGFAGVCAAAGDNSFDGGDGNDTVWFDQDPSCTTATMDLTSDLGLGTNTCGDDNDWLTTELPLNCTNYINLEPLECLDPN